MNVRDILADRTHMSRIQRTQIKGCMKPLSTEAKRWRWIVLSIAIACHPLADPQATVEPATQPLQVASPIVIVPTIVRSSAGDFVPGLTSQDFSVLDNGQKQETVEVEQTTDKPLAVVVVMQTGAGSWREFRRYQTVTKLLEITANVPIKKVGVVTFDSKPRQIWNFPARLDGVHYALENPEVGDGGAAIFDALSKASDLLEEQPSDMRRLIILLSQPQDAGSRTPPSSLLQRMGRTGAPIYSISFPQAATRDGRSKEKACLKEGAPRFLSPNVQSQVFAVRKGLCQDTAAELASASGGEHLRIRSQQDLDESVLRLKDTFSNAYTISFRPAPLTSGFHFLSLSAGKKADRLVVSSRSLYCVP
jgi:VWFA-related protein